MKKNESINYLNQISQDGFEALKNGRSTIALQKFQMILKKLVVPPHKEVLGGFHWVRFWQD